MTKFKIGDKVKVIKNVDEHKIGDVRLIKTVKVNGHLYNYGFEGGGFIKEEHIESTSSKNQRITKLESEIAELLPLKEEVEELKLIVHQLRKPSTTQSEIDVEQWSKGEVEGVIEYEGQQYQKVDRVAREGDVVVFTKCDADCVTVGKPYKTYDNGKLRFLDDVGDGLYVYDGGVANGTPKTVDVYELIVEDKQPPFTLAAHIEPKSPNQLRAEIIEKAKGFVESITNGGEYVVPFDEGEGQWFLRDFDFVVNESKRTIVALCKSLKGKVLKRSIAKCMPGDVFNEHIGRAIALGRALGLDVSEFEQAVQPTMLVAGTIAKYKRSNDIYTFDKIHENNRYDMTHKDGERFYEYPMTSKAENHYEIINDSNAIYGGVE